VRNQLGDRRLSNSRVSVRLVGSGLGLGSVAQTFVAQTVCSPKVWRPFQLLMHFILIGLCNMELVAVFFCLGQVTFYSDWLVA